MKNYLILLLTIVTFISCNNDDDNYHFEYVPTVGVELEAEFNYERYNRVTVTYELPESCYSYYYYDYIYDGTSRVIAPIAIVNEDVTCEETPREGRFSFDILATQSEPYILKFWQGVDIDENPIYLIIEVPVI